MDLTCKDYEDLDGIKLCDFFDGDDSTLPKEKLWLLEGKIRGLYKVAEHYQLKSEELEKKLNSLTLSKNSQNEEGEEGRDIDSLEYFKEHVGGKMGDPSSLRFQLSLNRDKDKAYLSNSSKLKRLPKLGQLVFFATPSADPNMDCFLKHVAPKEMKDFFLWGNKYYRDEEDAPTEIDGYIEGLKPVYAATKNRVGFHNCSFSSSAFEETVKASCNVPTLVFFYCNLNLDSEISFNGPKYAINTISFQGSGNSHKNDWASNPDKLRRVIKAISESDLRNSLQKISIDECNISVESVQSMLQEEGLDSNIQVVVEFVDCW